MLPHYISPRPIALGLALSLAPLSVAAELLHTRSGETLQSIARDRLGDSSRWREICTLNRAYFRGNCGKALPHGTFLQLPTTYGPLGPEVTRNPDPFRAPIQVPGGGAQVTPAAQPTTQQTTQPTVETAPAAQPGTADGSVPDGNNDPTLQPDPGAEEADQTTEATEEGTEEPEADRQIVFVPATPRTPQSTTEPATSGTQTTVTQQQPLIIEPQPEAAPAATPQPVVVPETPVAEPEDDSLWSLDMAAETGIPFTVPAGFGASLADDGSALFLFGHLANASSGGRPGVWAEVPAEVEAQVAGQTIRVSFELVADMDGPVALAYSTADTGNSGWREFELQRGQQEASFEYEVPPVQNAGGDYIGILPDPSDAGNIVGVRSVRIELVE